MNKKVLLLISILSITALGVVFHFVYDLLNQPDLIAFLVPINESVWEHLKLLFYPSIFVNFILFDKTNQPIGFIGALAYSIVVGMFIIVGGYYFYRIFFKDIAFINIALYGLSVIVSQLLIFNYSKIKVFKSISNRNGYIVIISILVLLTVFTYFQPKGNLFEEQSTGGKTYIII